MPSTMASPPLISNKIVKNIQRTVHKILTLLVKNLSFKVTFSKLLYIKEIFGGQSIYKIRTRNFGFKLA